MRLNLLPLYERLSDMPRAELEAWVEEAETLRDAMHAAYPTPAAEAKLVAARVLRRVSEYRERDGK